MARMLLENVAIYIYKKDMIINIQKLTCKIDYFLIGTGKENNLEGTCCHYTEMCYFMKNI